MNEFDNGLQKKWDYDNTVPFDSEVKPENLKNFLKPGDRLIFYGGEPLIMLEKIKEIMDFLKNSKIKFCIQTNGMLLNLIPKEYLIKFEKILISIDGDEKTDNENKGKIHYNQVLKNLQIIRENGFKGEIVARMVISPPKSFDVYNQVLHLVNLIKKRYLDSIHWQIDAGFYKNDFNEKEFSNFVNKYNHEITRLINWWIKEIKNGKIWKLYPFLGILNRLMKWDKETKIHCGAGYANYTITTSGKISACPILNSVKNFYCGDLNTPKEKLRKIYCEGNCLNCNFSKICGGRCLYWNYSRLWPKKGDELICKTIKHLIKILEDKIPEIEKIIQKNIFSEKDFKYEKYFGPEIIP
jgi:putative peptide-modifying radical SAM enzyme